MSDDLAVGLGAEFDARGHQLRAQRRVIFHDAVVNDGDLITRSVGMSVAFARCAMGGPPGVSDAQITAQLTLIQRIRQPFDLTEPPHALELSVVNDGEARGVVPTVFQAPQTLHKNGDHVTLGDTAYDSAHYVRAS